MKRKELKNLAKKIAQAEYARSIATDPADIKNAENEIIKLSGKISNIEEMLLLDDMIQEILQDYGLKNS